ncbi:hypothetical protein VNO80_15286 [Phaseolus coccineus]|uniref:Uncharacterized protein n=1 Tax=Phaseolus coccineus TaxID=3886 RepID=A0AAN9MK05_PHACN
MFSLRNPLFCSHFDFITIKIPSSILQPRPFNFACNLLLLLALKRVSVTPELEHVFQLRQNSNTRLVRGFLCSSSLEVEFFLCSSSLEVEFLGLGNTHQIVPSPQCCNLAFCDFHGEIVKFLKWAPRRNRFAL